MGNSTSIPAQNSSFFIYFENIKEPKEKSMFFNIAKFETTSTKNFNNYLQTIKHDFNDYFKDKPCSCSILYYKLNYGQSINEKSVITFEVYFLSNISDKKCQTNIICRKEFSSYINDLQDTKEVEKVMKKLFDKAVKYTSDAFENKLSAIEYHWNSKIEDPSQ